MVAATAPSAPAAPHHAVSHPSTPSPAVPDSPHLSTLDLSPLDQALLTRLYELPSLPALYDSLKKSPIENAPPTLFKLIQWAHMDHIKPWVDTHAAQQRDELRLEMVTLLKEIATTSDNQVERRRAATTILRTLTPRIRHAAGRSPRSDSPAHPLTSSPVHSHSGTQLSTLPSRLPRGTPRITPSPSLTHKQVATVLADAITRPDEPDSLATVEIFLSPWCSIQDEPTYNPSVQIHKLKRRGHRLTDLVPEGPFDDRSNNQTYFSTYDKRPYRTLFRLERSPDSTFPNAWLLADIRHDSS